MGEGVYKGRRIQGALGDENRRIEGERGRAVAKKRAEEWIRVKRKGQGPSQAPKELPRGLAEERKAGPQASHSRRFQAAPPPFAPASRCK